jgi:GNAT superfamily N-acetyltransferase
VIVRSLALKTELGLAATRATITDRGDYVVIETPDDPGYYYGNLLLLPAPPQVGEVSFWTRRFASELGGKPGIRHVTLWWDGTSGDVGAADELHAAGFTIEPSTVLTATRITAPPAELPIVALSPDQVLATADLAWAIGDRHDEHYREFLVRRARWRSTQIARGLATFYGAYDQGQLVASLGLVPMDRIARYQDVQTAAPYRKRGLAGAMLAAAARDVAADHYVILTAAGSDAERLYHRVGFTFAERTAAACRYPVSG